MIQTQHPTKHSSNQTPNKSPLPLTSYHKRLSEHPTKSPNITAREASYPSSLVLKASKLNLTTNLTTKTSISFLEQHVYVERIHDFHLDGRSDAWLHPDNLSHLANNLLERPTKVNLK